MGGFVVIPSFSDHDDVNILTPPTGSVTLYHYSGDGKFYIKLHDTTHEEVGGGGGGGGSGDFMADGSVPMDGTLDLANNVITGINYEQFNFSGGVGQVLIRSDGHLIFASDAIPLVVLSAPPVRTVEAIADHNQMLTTGTEIDITFDDASGIWADGFSQSDSTVLKALAKGAGDWELSAYMTVDCLGGGAIGTIVEVEIRVNGTAVSRASGRIDGAVSTQVYVFPKRVTLAEDDEVGVMVKQNSGSNINLHSNLTDAWSTLNLRSVT